MILVNQTASSGSSNIRWSVNKPVRIDHGTLCNRSTSSVTVTLEVGQRGGSIGCVVSGYSLAAGDTLSLNGYLVGASLDPEDYLRITTTAGSAIDVVITGSVGDSK